MTYFAFIDESYSAPIGGRAPYFYILASVTFSGSQLGDFQDALLRISPSGYFHTSEAAKTVNGREEIQALLKTLVALNPFVDLHFQDVESTDRFAESARARQFKNALAAIQTRHPGPKCVSVTYDRRQPGFPVKADERTINESRAAGIIERHLDVSAASLKGEIGLVAPDLVAWAFRRNHLGQDPVYWLLLENSKPRLP